MRKILATVLVVCAVAAIATGMSVRATTYALKGGTLSFGAGPARLQFSKGNVHASADEIYALIVDFRKWTTWSPHERMDPAMKRTYDGPATGRGSTYSWSGNDSVGQGRAQISESTSPNKIVVEFDFTKPFVGHLTVVFTIAKSDDDTEIAVATSGPAELVVGALNMFLGGDNLFGISCAAEASTNAMCNIMRKQLFGGK